MAIGVPYDWTSQRMNPLRAGGYYPSDIRDSPPAPIRDFEAWSMARRLPGRPEEGIYFPSIADTVGRGAPTMGPGIAVPIPPPIHSQELAPPPPQPTDYYPDIANNVGGGLPPVAQAPPSAPQPDIGPGIPLAPQPQVTSTDLPPMASGPSAPPGGMQFNPRDVMSAITSPGPPPSRRYSSTRPEFIFTNPASAQQAAANYAARLGYESNQDQAYQRYAGNLAAEREATQRATQATEAARINEQNRLAAIQSEGAANRASSERIAGMTEAVRQHRQAEENWRANEQAHQLGKSDADTVNKDPNMLAKTGTRFIKLNPQTGKWEPKFEHQEPPVPPSFLQGQPAVPMAPPPAPAPAAPAPQPTAAPPAAPQNTPLFGVGPGGPYVQLDEALRRIFR